ncbi:LOW QUALITY PROTEIN: Gag protein [Phytophthora palmivora]|uniref:Gag protein n=1 Tax=Phytophthora palmivora TaxID=4796 RepID=A0A2P4YTZ1_9STRA|nr:LOW QUALITY PROTEIN: Gag protein [Phytophthora palmivora]
MDRGEFPHLTDDQFESVRKMVGIFGGDALRSLAAATPAEQVERIEAFDTYGRGLVAHVQGLQAPVAKMKPAQPKPSRLKNLHFWFREVELAIDAALISTERLRVAFALPNLGGRAKTWAYTREATTPGCFTTWAQLCQQLRAAFLPANYEYRHDAQVASELLHVLNQMPRGVRVLAASLAGNPLPEHIKVTVFMDGLMVGPSHTQLFRVHANTMEEEVQIVLQEEYSHRQARTPTSELDRACMKGLDSWVQELLRARKIASRGGRPTGEDLSPHGRSADGARHGGLAPESLGALDTRKNSGGLFVGHASVRGYGDPFRILIDSGASTNFARRQTVVRDGDKFADALRESEGRGQVSVRRADGTVVNVPGVRMDLAVKFEDFDSSGSHRMMLLVLDMDNYDLILGMPWLEKHEPSVDWRGKAIGLAVSDRALVSNVPTSVRDWGARDGRQGAYAPEEVLEVTDSNEVVAMSLASGRETKAHCQACGIATTASPNAESRRAVWASSVAVPDGTDQAGNIVPLTAEAAEEDADGVSCVGNIGPQVGNISPQAGNVVPLTAEAAEEDADGVYCVSNIGPQVGNISPQAGNVVPQVAEAAEEDAESASCVGNIVPRRDKKTNTRAKVSLSTSRVDNKAPHAESETPPARPVEEQYHVFDGVSGRQVKAGAVQLEACQHY